MCVPSYAGLTHAYAVASPQAGRVEGRKRGPSGNLTPETRMGSALKRRALDRLHGRIPQAGPCSSFRRSLLLASARRRLWPQPLEGWHDFGQYLPVSSPAEFTVIGAAKHHGAALAKIVTAQRVFYYVTGSRFFNKR